MSASRRKAPFVRRSRPHERRHEILVPFTDDEYVAVEAEAAAAGMSVGDFLLMRALEMGKEDGNA